MKRNNGPILVMMLITIFSELIGVEVDIDPGQAFIMQQQQPDSTIKYGKDAEDRREKAERYLDLAESSKKQGKLANALRYYFSAVYELEVLEEELAIAETKTEIAHIFFDNSLPVNALEYYTASEKIYLESQSIRDRDDLLVWIGDTHYELADFEQAIKYYSRAITIQRDNNEDQAYINTLFKQVQCYNQLGQFEQSLERNRIILDYYRQEGNPDLEIAALNNLGFTAKNLGDHDKALGYIQEAIDLEKKSTGTKNPVTIVNKAIILQNMGNDEKAIQSLNEAATIVEDLNENTRAAEFNYLTALVYYNMKDYHNSLIYNNRSIRFAIDNNTPEILKNAYLLSSRIYEALYNYEEAIRRFQQHLVLKDSLRRAEMLTQQDLNTIAFRVERITRETENLWASEELSYLELQRLKLDSANRQQELKLLYQSDSIQKITIRNQRLETQRAKQALLLKEEQLFAQRKEKEVDSLRQVERLQAAELEAQQLVQKQQQTQIELLDRENQIAELNLKKVRTRNKYLVGFAALALLIIYLVYRGLRYAKRTNKILVHQKNEIEKQKDEIDHERQRSDKLLLNILPEETAEELKEKGVATPRHYNMVSVLFTDFKGFTKIAEKLTPRQLVAELNNCFLEFDKIIDKYGLEKIKTIGDAYMCAGGIPVENTTNPVDIVNAGLEIRQYMENLKKGREAKGMDYWELRIGIHTGQVVAGVVGKNKFAYDIWGDAVNTASRMESSGIPGKVNISGDTYKLIKDKFRCSYRGKIEAKNKGEIDMYIVEDIV